jgi:myo-inositol-1(or 4)-monophosphatase
MLNFAIETAREAGQILLEKFGRKINISKKGEIDLVTEADLASEKLIVEKISSHYPRHAILAEESGLNDVSSEYKWIIDPLDGTTNYAHGYPCFAVNIALEYQGSIIVAVTYDPTRNEIFSAERGQGANLNGRRIRVSETEKLGDALTVTGFPYNFAQKKDFAKNLTNFLLNARGVRRDGSAAIDMAYVACGRFDGMWEDGLNPWDMAAGVLLIEEAGGKITSYDHSAFNLYTTPLCASNGLIHDEMIKVLRQ